MCVCVCVCVCVFPWFFSALVSLGEFSIDVNFTFYCLDCFVSKVALFILIDLGFSVFSNLFFDLTAFMFCIASGAKLSFASV